MSPAEGVDKLISEIYESPSISVEEEICESDDCGLCGPLVYTLLAEDKTLFYSDWFGLDKLSEERF